MSKRYAIWDKQTPIITPSMEVFTPEQWMERYPVAKIDSVTVLCAPGEINGGLFATMGQMVQIYQEQGADFSACTTDEERLAVIEAFDDAKEAEAQAARAAAKEAEETSAMNSELTATSLASIAASMEYQNLLTLEDTEVE